MIVKVRKKEFNIELVSNYVNKLYTELTEASYNLSELSYALRDSAEKRQKDLKGIKDLDKIKELNAEFNDEVLDYNSQLKEQTSIVTSKRWLIIKELIESNDYDFENDWWDRRTSVEDLNNFMLECLGNDQKENKKSYGKKKSRK